MTPTGFAPVGDLWSRSREHRSNHNGIEAHDRTESIFRALVFRNGKRANFLQVTVELHSLKKGWPTKSLSQDFFLWHRLLLLLRLVRNKSNHSSHAYQYTAWTEEQSVPILEIRSPTAASSPNRKGTILYSYVMIHAVVELTGETGWQLALNKALGADIAHLFNFQVNLPNFAISIDQALRDFSLADGSRIWWLTHSSVDICGNLEVKCIRSVVANIENARAAARQ